MAGRAAHSQVYEGVVLGRGTVLEDPCVVGKPARGRAPGEVETHVGDDATIRPFTTIYAGATIGDRFQSGQGVSIREDNVLGNDVGIGTNTVLEHGNRIGDGTRVHTGCFLELVTLGRDVFVGPNVVFADDPHPPCPRYVDCVRGAVVEDGVAIGANATILPGVHIGAGAVIGAGSVVTSDIPAGVVACGNPARVIKRAEEIVCMLDHEYQPYGSHDAAQAAHD